MSTVAAALRDARPDDQGTLRQVVFITDGAIGNEQELFATIGQGRGRSRIFMVGIGSAPNTFLMTRATELGRGAFSRPVIVQGPSDLERLGRQQRSV